MFKKFVALTLAALMFLNPMTAFAVSWGEVVNGLSKSGSYTNSDAGIEAKSEDGTVTVTGTNGKIENFEAWMMGNDEDYVFQGTLTIGGEIFNVVSMSGANRNVDLAKNVTVEVDHMIVGALEGGTTTLKNYGTIKVKPDSDRPEDEAPNSVSIWGENGSVNFVNEGDVTGNVEVAAFGNAEVGMSNKGTVNGDVMSNALGGSAIMISNEGAVNGTLWAAAYDKGSLSVNNNGNVETLGVDIYDNATVSVNSGENATVKEAAIYINTPSADTLSAEKIQEILKKIDLPEDTKVGAELWIVNDEYDPTAVYQINADGTVTLIEVFNQEPYVDPDDPKNWSKERIRHEMEEKRKAQAIGGVYGSPYWLKQLYLGYMSLNLRLFEGEERILFKESLSWLVEERAKLITFRIRQENPQDLTMRLDGTVIQVLEQAEISTIAIVDGDGDLFMQYKVADIKAAREKYGLATEDLIVIGAADADVMKIGADGRLVPIEGEAAAVPAA